MLPLGVRQDYARKFTIPIDILTLEYEVMHQEKEMPEKPEDGAFVNVSGHWSRLTVNGSCKITKIYNY